MKTKYHLVFEKLFQAYYSNLIGYACKYTYSRSAAEDILQDVFMSMWVNKGNIDFSRGDIKSYLYRAVHNRCINYVKSIKITLPLGNGNIDFLIQREVAGEVSFNHLSLQDMECQIRSCVEELPPQCKEVFTCSRTLGLKNKEIAELLHISEKAVEKQITKALKKIRQSLQESC